MTDNPTLLYAIKDMRSNLGFMFGATPPTWVAVLQSALAMAHDEFEALCAAEESRDTPECIYGEEC